MTKESCNLIECEYILVNHLKFCGLHYGENFFISYGIN